MFKEEFTTENHKTNNLIDISKDIKFFNEYLKGTADISMIGLIGEYGSGKSTMLHQLEQITKGEYLWVNFDAWKYPERKELWESFIVDFATQVDKKQSIVDRIKGNSTGKGLSGVAEEVAKAIPVPALPQIAALFGQLFAKEPIEKIHELQEILHELINEQEKPIVIVLEDIDRSADMGIYFIQTMRHFMNSNKLKNEIRIIIPISEDNYKKGQDSYLKCLDYQYPFEFKQPIFLEFVKNGFNLPNDEDKADAKPANADLFIKQIAGFLESLFMEYPNQITIRKIKLILRHTNAAYNELRRLLLAPDYRMVLCIETSKLILVPAKSDIKLTYHQAFINNSRISSNSVFSAFINCIYSGKPSPIIKHHDSETEGRTLIESVDFELVGQKFEKFLALPYLVEREPYEAIEGKAAKHCVDIKYLTYRSRFDYSI